MVQSILLQGVLNVGLLLFVKLARELGINIVELRPGRITEAPPQIP
jgi:hypothetical protein